MTREEALKEIKEEFNEFLKGTGLDNEKYLKYEMETNEDLRKVVEANRMAIEALEQEHSRSAEITQYRYDCEKLMEENEQLKKALEQEPKTGHWIDYGTKYDVRCSICNTQYPFKPIGSSRLMGCKSNYCPGCGAKMIEAQESEE